MSTEKGVKLDTGKDRWDLLPLELIEGIVKVLTFGASKYTDNGWQSVDNAKARYIAAMMRHWVMYNEHGEEYDKESGLHHLDHMMTNAMFLRYFAEVSK